MWKDLCQRLCCPADQGELRLEGADSSARIDEGYLVCSLSEDHTYPIHSGIADFRSESYDHWAGDEQAEYGTIVTPAVAHRLRGIASGWTLDAGCARGAYQSYVGGRYVGIDLILPFLVDAQNRYPHSDFIAGDIRRLPFKSGTFDIIVSSQVVEHLSGADLGTVLREFARTCRGHVLVDTPNESAAVGWLRIVVYGQEAAAGHDVQSPLAHRLKMTPSRLRSLGFSVEGCIGHVSRRRFQLPRLWDAYDQIARRFPSIGSNLIGTANLSRDPRLVRAGR